MSQHHTELKIQLSPEFVEFALDQRAFAKVNLGLVYTVDRQREHLTGEMLEELHS